MPFKDKKKQKEYMKMYKPAYDEATKILKEIHKEEFMILLEDLLKGGKDGKENKLC